AALGLPPLGLALGLVLAPAAAFGLAALARRRIGGQTGDVVGACQQVGEIAVLLALVAATA
ncbi:adenosylcobinamide-GDP ribazoletransferase, partial [Methylobacterium sp. Leaf118]|uniref:adenosylcobinamide-GDP ribazoletransferase n=1 Tax=Methylobacterium sp. Leaf118 TaxID=2876562 RepID=UPI001E600EB4